MHIKIIDATTEARFKEMFANYYAELGCDDDAEHLLDEYVLPDMRAGLVNIAVAEAENEPCGFVVWQGDSIENEWCMREGEGTVRELFVEPYMRGNGVGKNLLSFAEGRIKESGAVRAYVLPSEGSDAFFMLCGYAESDERCDDMDCNFFYKTL